MSHPIVHIICAARPNFMKAAPLYHALKAHGGITPRLVHTGQHYDDNMSGAFFRDLGLPEPDFRLDVGSGRHGAQTAAVIERYEALCLDMEQPDLVVVIGDVNSTIGAALAASKIGIKVAHLEAGLRSGDRSMPEELNRLATDALANYLWTPSFDADENLRNEGQPPEKIACVGNIMIDSYELQKDRIKADGSAEKLGLTQKKYAVVTLHRPGNVDEREALEAIMGALENVSRDVTLVWPLHPRTRARLQSFGMMDTAARIAMLIEPQSYIPFMNLVSGAAFVITDSGGVQEETSYLGIPCLTLRPNTERPVTISHGTNELLDASRLYERVNNIRTNGVVQKGPPPLWDGQAASRIVSHLEKIFGIT